MTTKRCHQCEVMFVDHFEGNLDLCGDCRLSKMLTFNDIRPRITDGMAFCSCYVSTTGNKCGDCPQYVKHAPNYWCRIGNGTEGGSICTPYYREIGELEARLDFLKQAMIGNLCSKHIKK